MDVFTWLRSSEGRRKARSSRRLSAASGSVVAIHNEEVAQKRNQQRRASLTFLSASPAAKVVESPFAACFYDPAGARNVRRKGGGRGIGGSSSSSPAAVPSRAAPRAPATAAVGAASTFSSIAGGLEGAAEEALMTGTHSGPRDGLAAHRFPHHSGHGASYQVWAPATAAAAAAPPISSASALPTSLPPPSQTASVPTVPPAGAPMPVAQAPIQQPLAALPPPIYTSKVVMLDIEVDRTLGQQVARGPDGSTMMLPSGQTRHHIVSATDITASRSASLGPRLTQLVQAPPRPISKPEVLAVSEGVNAKLHLPSGASIHPHVTYHTLALVRVPTLVPSPPGGGVEAMPPPPQPIQVHHTPPILPYQPSPQLAPAMPPASPDLSGQSATITAVGAPYDPTSALLMASSVQQGIVFGLVSTLTVELIQLLVLTKKEGESKWGRSLDFCHGLARGALAGAAGAVMAVLAAGPLAPTALFVGWGVLREWYMQLASYFASEVTFSEAGARAGEALLAAVGGVSLAFATASAMAGASGLVIAATAGCSGLAGSLLGRALGTTLCSKLLSERIAEEESLLAAYRHLAVKPPCPDRALRLAYRRAYMELSVTGGVNDDSDRELQRRRLAALSAAMDRIERARGVRLRSFEQLERSNCSEQWRGSQKMLAICDEGGSGRADGRKKSLVVQLVRPKLEFV
eukprot:CAMPEP_0206533332 /NCGR_PEP_ID=MMETSP0325_2-20121206/4893_1 /ASSEMBLY_ACC=CAM_ASM_000347 /TAXON_ID=2866 /ORGANISM="Crypthecodinium cohnii, Strain Seligo" /LENGTH=688 /DNA_ID=CAMNT_0054029937 /DNA_START=300 /DNA_END=2367 /DNA_ORIENTATION=-